MNQKKLVYMFLIMSISLILSLPILNLSFAYKNEKMNIENFTKKQLFSTDNLESIINYFVYEIFNFSLDTSQVIAGKDKFLFLGNSYVSVIDKTNGTFYYTDKQINVWTSKLKQIQDWYEKLGIKFVMVVASNKHTIYNDKLPKSIVYREGKTITDDIVESALKKNIHILDLKKVLKYNKQYKQLYYKTDTHWNHYGAFIGYINTVKYLNTLYRKKFKIPEYDMKEILLKEGGDLTRFLKINHFLADNGEVDYKFIFESNSKLCYGKISKTYQLKKCSPRIIKKDFNQYIINNNAPNKEKLLYLCDSFGMKNTQAYSETFNTLWRLHLGYINGITLANFIQKHKPDIVIYEIVERNLGSYYTVVDLPKILK